MRMKRDETTMSNGWTKAWPARNTIKPAKPPAPPPGRIYEFPQSRLSSLPVNLGAIESPASDAEWQLLYTLIAQLSWFLDVCNG